MMGDERRERTAITPRRAARKERDRRPETGKAARERKELDRRLDEALACTFPASDPFDLSPRRRTGDESD
jgi:hypothetical protein